MLNRILLSIFYRLKNYYTKMRVKSLKFGHLGENVLILNGFDIGYAENLYVEDDVIIGPNTFLNCEGGVVIKRGSGLGPGTTIYSVNHSYKNPSYIPFDPAENDIKQKVVINESCWIGCNVIILPGVEIGERCVIGAGSVVTKSIPPFSLAAGNPAKVIKQIPVDNYYELKKEEKYCFALTRKK